MGKFDKHLKEAEEAKLELKKAQERIKVKALVLSAKSKIKRQGAKLQSELEAVANDLAQSTRGLSSEISPVLKGFAGEAVQSSASSIPKPNFENPIH